MQPRGPQQRAVVAAVPEGTRPQVALRPSGITAGAVRERGRIGNAPVGQLVAAGPGPRPNAVTEIRVLRTGAGL